MLLYQLKDGYCYNSDTHFLFNFIFNSLKKFKNIQGELLDVGSGSGILGLLVARTYGRLKLNQCEIQEEFQFLSQKNALVNGIEANIYKTNYLELDKQNCFDIIVSNPPFYHSEVVKSENKNKYIARYNDNMPLEAFIEKASKLLKNGGKFFFCYDVKQINDIIFSLKKYKLNLESLQFVHPKDDKSATLILVYARKNSKSLCDIQAPLIVFDQEGEFTKEVQEIYKFSSTHSIKVDECF